MDEQSLALIFKAISDKSRVNILKQLAEGEKCANDLLAALSIGQPTLSHHMQILCKSGLVKCRKDGKWVRYILNPENLKKIQIFVDTLLVNE
ncbi:MAG: helix-turn-helix transcriptional regulator [Clostridiales bacterium]|nr:helix-turn-helix transcriptional regulator [Clostridiales bacterium]